MTSRPQNENQKAQDGAPPVVFLRLLGPFSLEVAGVGEIAISSKKNRALLAILALSPGRKLTRDKLCGMLWGDRGDEQARSSLRQSMAILRKELAEAEHFVLAKQDDVLSLQPAHLSVDVLDLTRLAAASELSGLREAAALWRGELMSDTEIRDPGFSDWISAERLRLVELAIAVHQKLADQERGAVAVDWARRLVSLDPLREASHRTLMKALASDGGRTQALRHYELCRQILKVELNVAPARETSELLQEIANDGPVDRARTGLERDEAGTAGNPESLGNDSTSLAVMPFANLSEDREQQYLADGLTDDLITDLSKASGLSVIAAHSMLKFRDERLEPLEAARLLKVRHAVQGSLRRVQDTLRINAKLVDAETGKIVWADRYDRKPDAIHEIQADIARSVAGALTGSAAIAVERYRPRTLEAFDLVMRGRKEFRHSDEAGSKAAPLFEKAIELDPNFSEAYRWLALGQCISWLYFGASEQPARSLSIDNASKAIACDPGDAAAHAIQAFILMYERQWDAANAAFGRALTLNPFDGDAWASLSDLRVMEGRGREAVECALRSLDRNPRPLGSFYWALGQAQIAAGDLEDAVGTLRREETYATTSRRHLAVALTLSGRLEEARAEARLFMADHPYFGIGQWVRNMPFRDLAMRSKFVEAYRLAGLPE